MDQVGTGQELRYFTGTAEQNSQMEQTSLIKRPMKEVNLRKLKISTNLGQIAND